jgi:hypothetical protein
LHFKLRVLDLMEVFLKANAQSPMILFALELLLGLYLSSSSRKDDVQLFNKLKSLISRAVANKTIPVVESIKPSMDLLIKIHEWARTLGDANNTLCYSMNFIIKILLNTEDESVKKSKSNEPKGQTKVRFFNTNSNSPLLF